MLLDDEKWADVQLIRNEISLILKSWIYNPIAKIWLIIYQSKCILILVCIKKGFLLLFFQKIHDFHIELENWWMQIEDQWTQVEDQWIQMEDQWTQMEDQWTHWGAVTRNGRSVNTNGRSMNTNGGSANTNGGSVKNKWRINEHKWRISEHKWRISKRNFTIIFPLYRERYYYWWRKSDYPEKPIDMSQVDDKLYHLGCFQYALLRPRIELAYISGDRHCIAYEDVTQTTILKSHLSLAPVYI